MKRNFIILALMAVMAVPGYVNAADTIGTKSQCLNLLPLGIPGAISPQDVRDCVVSVWDDIETLESAPSGSGGDEVSVDATSTTDPNFDSSGDIDFVNTSDTITANIKADTVAENELDESTNFTGTGEWNFGTGGIEIENGTTRPSCTVGQIFLDTDAPSGTQLYGCEGGTFVLQGDGSGTGMSNLVDDVTPQLGGPLDGQNEVISDVTLKGYSETTGTASVSSGILTIDVTAGNVQFHTLSTNVSEIDFTNVPTGKVTTITIYLTQHASAAKTVDFTVLEINSSSVQDLWSGGVPSTMSSGVGDIDSFVFTLIPALSQIVAYTGGQNFGP